MIRRLTQPPLQHLQKAVTLQLRGGFFGLRFAAETDAQQAERKEFQELLRRQRRPADAGD